MLSTEITIPKKTVIGDWKTGKSLGAGGQGAVWEVRRVRGKSPPMALKACFLDDPTARARFLREIHLLRECESPNVLRLVDSAENWESRIEGLPDVAFYVGELCSGTLADESERSDNVADLIELFRQACDALAVLHSRDNPVIHRDIKPENFLVAIEPRRLVIADFGIAKEEEQDTKLTGTNEVVGSPFFRAPEVLNGSPATIRSDVYSMGRLLEWLLAGRLPADLIPKPVPRGGLLSDDACDLLDRIIGRASGMDPTIRYRSVVDLADAVPSLWYSVKPRTQKDAPVPKPGSAESVRRQALELARGGDQVGWRELERPIRRAYPRAVTEWRSHHEKTPFRNRDDLMPVIDDIMERALPRMTLAWAGVYSQAPGFVDQRRILEDLVTIDGWNPGGKTILIGGPRGVAYCFQYVHGAICFEIGRPDLAIQFATTSLPRQRRHDELHPIWRHYELSFAPDLFEKAGWAWDYVLAFPEHHPVVREFFALDRDYEVGIAAYNLLLSLLELGADAEKVLKEGPENLELEVRPLATILKYPVVQAAFSRTFADKQVVAQVAAATNGDVANMRKLWPHWKNRLQQFRSRWHSDRFYADDVELGELA